MGKEKFEFTTSILKTFFHLFFFFRFILIRIKKSLVLSRNPPFFLFSIYIQIISTRDFRNAKKIIPFHLFCSLSAIFLYPLHSINSAPHKAHIKCFNHSYPYFSSFYFIYSFLDVITIKAALLCNLIFFSFFLTFYP